MSEELEPRKLTAHEQEIAEVSVAFVKKLIGEDKSEHLAMGLEPTIISILGNSTHAEKLALSEKLLDIVKLFKPETIADRQLVLDILLEEGRKKPQIQVFIDVYEAGKIVDRRFEKSSLWKMLKPN